MGPAARGRATGWGMEAHIEADPPTTPPASDLLPAQSCLLDPQQASIPRTFFAISRTQLSVPNSQGNPTGDKMLRNYLLDGLNSPDSLVSFFYPLLEDCSGGTCPRLRIQVSKDACPSWMND